jgi:hypothetical protein
MASTDSTYDMADVLHRIACDAQAIVRSLGHVYDEENPSTRVDVAIALAGRIGAPADMMEPIAVNLPQVAQPDEWLLTRVSI